MIQFDFQLEKQLLIFFKAAALLTEETKKRITSEGKFREMEDMSEKFKSMEEANKR